MGLLLVATPLLNCTNLRVDNSLGPLWNGLWYSGGVLLAVWAALGEGPLTRRLPRSFALAWLLMLGTIWSHLRNYGSVNIPGQAMSVLYVYVFVGLLLALARRTLGWRIGMPSEPDRPTTLQFSLRQALTWMLGLAVGLGALRLVLAADPQLLAWIGYGFFWQILLAAILVGALLPFLLPSLALVLAPRLRWTSVGVAGLSLGACLLLLYVFCPVEWAFPLVIGLAVLLLVLLLAALASRRQGLMAAAWGLSVVLFPIPLQLYCPWIGATWIGVGILATLIGTLLVVRLCGYRLLSRGGWLLAAEEPPVAGVTVVPGRGRFAAILTAIVLLATGAVWPIAQLEPMRWAYARQMAIMQEWCKVEAFARWDEQERIVAVSAFVGSAPSDALFEKLEGLRQSETLVSLGLSGGLRDEQMYRLSNRPFLQTLCLLNNPITDAGLAQLEGLPQLRHLQLNATRITDAGLRTLRQWPELETLNLIDTQISDAGLAYLEGLTNLQHLFLANTQVTPEGVRRLQAKLPQCTIDTVNPRP